MATDILPGARLALFETWTTTRSGIVLRDELTAKDVADAVDRAFRRHPQAQACGARLLRSTPPRDALAELERRRTEVSS